MSSNVELNDDQLEDLINSGGLKQVTLDKREAVIKKFKTYIAKNYEEAYEEIIQDKSKVQKVMIRYLETLRVDKKGSKETVRPKSLYFQAILSHLKVGLAQERWFDFSNKIEFNQLYKGVSAIKKNIKSEGRGNVKHTKAIPQDTLLLIFGLLANVQAVLQSRIYQNEAQYKLDLEKLPEKHRWARFLW